METDLDRMYKECVWLKSKLVDWGSAPKIPVDVVFSQIEKLTNIVMDLIKYQRGQK